VVTTTGESLEPWALSLSKGTLFINNYS